MITPPFFDCNVWIGEPEEQPVGSRLYRPPSGGLDSPDALLAEMDRTGIDRALVYHVSAREDDVKTGNERLLDEIEAYPRLEPCWVISPDAIDEYGSVTAFVDAMTEAGVTAVRMFPGEHGYHLLDDRSELLLTALERAGAILILDALSGILSDGFTYEDVGEVCTKHQHRTFDRPELRVVVTNLVRPTMGSFYRMKEVVETVNSVGNLFIDTARLQVHDGLRQFVDECGVDRLLFGSHLPHASAGAGIATVMQSSLTRTERHKVAGENLSRMLGETAVDWETAGRAPVRSLKTVPYEIIDMHGHVREDGEPGDRYPDAHGIVEQMDRTGIALCCVSRTGGEPPAGNDTVAKAARRFPDRLVPLAVANPNWDDVRGELERCFDEHGMRMIKIHPVSHDTEPDDPSYDPVWEFANERGCLIVTHTLCHDDERDAWIDRAKNNPNATLMLYHAGRAWNRVDNFVEVVEQCPNVLLEITFSYNIDGIIEHLVDAVGPERVFFGTDLGARAPESQVGWAAYARISEEDRQLHMRENALGLLEEMGALPAAYEGERSE